MLLNISMRISYRTNKSCCRTHTHTQMVLSNWTMPFLCQVIFIMSIWQHSFRSFPFLPHFLLYFFFRSSCLIFHLESSPIYWCVVDVSLLFDCIHFQAHGKKIQRLNGNFRARLQVSTAAVAAAGRLGDAARQPDSTSCSRSVRKKCRKAKKKRGARSYRDITNTKNGRICITTVFDTDELKFAQ